MKNWNNTYRKRAIQDLVEYRKMMQLAPVFRDEKQLKKLRRRLGMA